VLEDSQDASSLSNHARALVENQYGWPAICRALLKSYAAAQAN
jgi:glycosyltransferase involved in cell wall biosynthesis